MINCEPTYSYLSYSNWELDECLKEHTISENEKKGSLLFLKAHLYDVGFVRDLPHNIALYILKIKTTLHYSEKKIRKYRFEKEQIKRVCRHIESEHILHQKSVEKNNEHEKMMEGFYKQIELEQRIADLEEKNEISKIRKTKNNKKCSIQ